MSLKINHHLDPATLVAYSAGSLGEALSAVVSAHLEMCPQCRAELDDMDLMGGVLFEAMALAPGGARAKAPMPPVDNVIRMACRQGVDGGAAALTSHVPRVFAARASVDLDDVPWRRLAPGIWHYPLKLSRGVKGDLRLLKISAGKRMPVHGHGGTELTLVLDGTYSDEDGRYACGDIQDVDGEHEHRPIADEQAGCICIIASERPARYRSLFNRLMQPLTGI
jgi:putative transcriptional regulator